jgi:hypothetical protein
MANETNISLSDLKRAAAYASSTVNQVTSSATSFIKKGVDKILPTKKREVPGVPPGAQPAVPGAPTVIVRNAVGQEMLTDLRAKIRVPPDYLVASTSGFGDELKSHGGIIFPYTPDITFDAKADYSPMSITHSNFALNFYKSSSIGSISITGKFSVENLADAGVYLATKHLLFALTRMRSGKELFAGSAPPVCRLDAYGDMMLKNVPIAITSFKIELASTVDYFKIPNTSPYGEASVPTLSTFSITCLPMYSRGEMQRFTVTDYLSGAANKKKGYI